MVAKCDRCRRVECIGSDRLEGLCDPRARFPGPQQGQEAVLDSGDETEALSSVGGRDGICHPPSLVGDAVWGGQYTVSDDKGQGPSQVRHKEANKT